MTVELFETTAVQAKIATDGKVRMTPAYSGGFLYTRDYDVPSIVDLETLEIGPDVPILLDHKLDRHVGTCTNVSIKNGGIIAYGNVETEEKYLGSRDFLELEKYRRACKPKPSIGVNWCINDPSKQIEWIASDQMVNVNSRDFKGPCVVIRNAKLDHIALVSDGGDPHGRAILAKIKDEICAEASGGTVMVWEDFLVSKELTQELFDALTTEEQDALKLEFDSLSASESVEAEAEGEEATEEVISGSADLAENVQTLIEAPSEEAQTEAAIAIVEAISEIEGASETEDPAVQAKIRAVRAKIREKLGLPARSGGKAVRAAVGPEKRAAKQWRVVRNRMPKSAVRARVGSSVSCSDVYRARFMRSIGCTEDTIANFGFDSGFGGHGYDSKRGERAVNAAIGTRQFSPGRTSFREIVNANFEAVGQPRIGDSEPPVSALRRLNNIHAVNASIGGNSTFDALEVLNASMNALLLQKAAELDPVYKHFVHEVSVDDFREVQYLDAEVIGRMEELVEGGPIAHLKTVPTNMRVQAKSHAAQITVDLINLINDRNLGVLDRAIQQMANIGEQTKNADIMAYVLGLVDGSIKAQDGSNFFSADRGNYFTGSGSNIQDSGTSALKQALKAFRMFTNQNGYPLELTPKQILTGPENEDIFKRILTSERTTEDSDLGDRQIYRDYGLDTVFTSFLSTNFGANDSWWFLQADNAIRPWIGCAVVAGSSGLELEEDQSIKTNSYSRGYRLVSHYGVFSMYPDGVVLSDGVSASS